MRWDNGLLVPAVCYVCLCIGCGSDTQLEGLVDAGGTVTYKGAPVDGATVTFAPQGEGRAASGRTDASGNFRLTTLNANDGVAPGQYKVTVSKIENTDPHTQVTAEQMAQMVAGGQAAPSGPTPRAEAKSGGIVHHVPEKYESADTSGLTADVSGGGGNDFKFDLTD